MKLRKIAWRNLTRNKMRTFIAIVAIMTVVIIVIFSRGFVIGVTETMFGLNIDNASGHVRIVQEEYEIRESLLPLDMTVDGFAGEGAAEMAAELEAHPDVEYVLPRVRFGAMASLNDDLTRMLGIGFDLEREKIHGAVPEDIDQGRMPAEENEAVFGSGLLEDMNKEVGESITLMFSDAHQSLQARTFQIVGRRDSGVSELDNNFFYIPLEHSQEMLWLEDEVTEIMVFGRSAGLAPELEQRITGLLSERGGTDYSTVNWQEADPMVEMFREVDEIMEIAYILFIVLGSIVILSVMTMIVRERTPEIGMMSALGLKGREIMKVFVLEGALMGLIGSILGIILGGIFTFRYSRTGIYVEVFAEMMDEHVEFMMEPVFHLGFSLENLLLTFVASMIIVVLACLYSARKAAKLNPADALQYIDE